MKPTTFSRRKFAGLVLVQTAAAQQTPGLTARKVIERIKQNVGVPWREKTVDTFKAGNPDTPVTGIATTFMATLDVLQRAAASGKNLVISHEPTFYNHEDSTTDLGADNTLAFKQKFIEQHNMVVFRFHDHQHARKPDMVMLGLAQTLGWDRFQAGDNQRFYNLPPTTLGALATDAKKRLNARVLRTIGDPSLKVSRIALSPGYNSLMGALQLLPRADVLVVGEAREWEGVELAQDIAASGEKKGMILLGHALSEDPGMRLCATWLKTFIPEVPIEWIPAGEPFWNPA